MRNMIKNSWLIGICLFLASCGDFLEEYSQDLTYATNCNDLEELLVGGAYAIQSTMASGGGGFGNGGNISSATNGVYFPGLHVMDDDVECVVYGQENGNQSYKLLGAFYRWAVNPCNDGEKDYDDPAWQVLYTHIGVTNAVLDKVEEFVDEEEEDRNRVKGQAYFLRAYYYWYLINMYAKPYSAITADRDLGVPLKDFSYIDDRYWERATVKEVYDRILSDLREAVRCLEGQEPKNIYWAGEDAARLLLGRVLCYTGQWSEVPGICEELLNGKYQLANLVANSEAPYISTDSPELIFTMGANMRERVFYHPNSTGLAGFKVSDELFNLYEEGDVRKSVRYTNKSQANILPFYAPAAMGVNLSDVFTMRFSEVYLNLAEAYAMNGDEERARELLQTLRSNRIAAEHLGTVTEQGEELIKRIREERRKELCFEGHRWFDLRRYAVSPNYPESKDIIHPSYSPTTGNFQQQGLYDGDYVLPSYPSNNWVLPIPEFDIQENQGRLEGNERDEIVLN